MRLVEMLPLFDHTCMPPIISRQTINASGCRGVIQEARDQMRLHMLMAVQLCPSLSLVRRACEGACRNLGSRVISVVFCLTSADLIRKGPEPSLICNLHGQASLLFREDT
jgi:hypothetical protein